LPVLAQASQGLGGHNTDSFGRPVIAAAPSASTAARSVAAAASASAASAAMPAVVPAVFPTVQGHRCGTVRIAVHIAARGVELRAGVPGAKEMAEVTEEQGAVASVEGEEDQPVEEEEEREPDGAPPAAPLDIPEHERRQEQCAPVSAPGSVCGRETEGRERETEGVREREREREGEKEKFV